jgi:poly(glycerol-phosphate) alpha-glucosyltransferase
VFEALVAQCGVLRRIGHEPVVIALAGSHDAEDHARFGEAEVIVVKPVGPATIGYAPGLAKALLAARLDLLHLHGIWQYPSAAASRWAKATGRPYLVSPHGMLEPYITARGRLKKAIARIAYERASWRRASFQALTADEAADIRAATGRGDSFVIPNAVDVAVGGFERAPVLAYIGRIHPKKNLAGLVEGWRRARNVLTPLGARLRIAGWGEDAHVADLRGWIAAAGGDDIEFIGPAFGAEKAALLGSARFLALPSFSEGLPMAVLEAWSAGTPTLMSRECHLPEGVAAGAAFDCGTDPETIAAAIRAAAALDEGEWQAMSGAASLLAREAFSPEAVARRWQQAYSALLQPPPRAL